MDSNNNCSHNKFKLVFSNVYLNRIIKNHLFYFNFYSGNRAFGSIKEFLEFKYIDYLYSVDFKFPIEEDMNLDELIPPNIESIIISEKSSGFQFKAINSIQFKHNLANSIKRLILNGHFNEIIIKNSNLQYLKISSSYINFKGSFFGSITELDIVNYDLPLKRGYLNNIGGLKKLACQYKRSSQKGSIPESVTSLILYCSDNNIGRSSVRFIAGFLPRGLLELNILGIYCTKINLELDENLPDSITSMNLENLDRLDFKLPNSLKKLDISLSINDVDDSSRVTAEWLPSGLESFCFNGISNFDSLVLPSSLKKLEFSLHASGASFNRQLTKQFIPSTLTDLSFKNYNPSRLLIPNGFNNQGYVLEDSLFQHTALTSINFGDHFNQFIQPNVLPSSLRILELGFKFDKEIIADSIPFNLKLLKINNQAYQHPIILNNPYTMVDSINYIKQFEKYPEKLIVLKMPIKFDRNTKHPSLREFINLQVLDLDSPYTLDEFIKEDLPITNSIKKIVLFCTFQSVINLDDFPKLEVLVVNSSNPNIISTSNNLKSIVVNSNNNQFLESLDPRYYQLIKFKNLKY